MFSTQLLLSAKEGSVIAARQREPWLFLWILPPALVGWPLYCWQHWWSCLSTWPSYDIIPKGGGTTLCCLLGTGWKSTSQMVPSVTDRVGREQFTTSWQEGQSSSYLSSLTNFLLSPSWEHWLASTSLITAVPGQKSRLVNSLWG